MVVQIIIVEVLRDSKVPHLNTSRKIKDIEPYTTSRKIKDIEIYT